MSFYIKPTSDIFIHYLLGSEHNKELLLSFINAVLENAGLKQVTAVEILNPFHIKMYPDDKLSIVDIKATDSSGATFHIEVQAIHQKDYINRSLYYWARAYTDQLEGSQQYMNLRPVISINLLEFTLIPELMQVHSVFKPIEKDNPDFCLTEHFELHYIELSKLSAIDPKSRRLNTWLQYLLNEGRQGAENIMKTIIKDNPDIEKAHREYRTFTGNDEYRQAYEAQLKLERDINSQLYTAEAKGELTARLETARNMLNEGDSIEKILRVTGLTEAQLKEHGVVK